MLSKFERQRFHTLRDRQFEGESLSPAEEAEVAAFISRIEQAEAVYLQPANERLRAENLAADERIRGLQALAEREERFLARLRVTLAEIEFEQKAMTAERKRILSNVISM